MTTPINDEVITALLAGHHVNLFCAAVNSSQKEMDRTELEFELSKRVFMLQLMADKLKFIVDLLTPEQKLQAASMLLGFNKADA